MLQIAHGDANIWHSLVAFSSFHEQFLSPMEDNDMNCFALSQYNKSLKGISTLQSTRSTAHAHIVSCILYICIEVSTLTLLHEPQLTGLDPSRESRWLN